VLTSSEARSAQKWASLWLRSLPSGCAPSSARGLSTASTGPYGVRDAVDLEADAETSRRLAEKRHEPEATCPSAEALVAADKQGFEASGIWNEHLAAVAAYNAVELPDGRFVHAWRKSARDEYTQLHFGYRFECYYEALECPVLFLPGEREYNDVLICEAMTGFSRLVDRCDVVLVPGAVHPYGWMLIAHEMSQAVIDFHAEIGA
jgi:2-succinyl-6-hydroxy-2,4-cyclohexadiene-1-carboxylate synthase